MRKNTWIISCLIDNINKEHRKKFTESSVIHVLGIMIITFVILYLEIWKLNFHNYKYSTNVMIS